MFHNRCITLQILQKFICLDALYTYIKIYRYYLIFILIFIYTSEAWDEKVVKYTNAGDTTEIKIQWLTNPIKLK